MQSVCCFFVYSYFFSQQTKLEGKLRSIAIHISYALRGPVSTVMPYGKRAMSYVHLYKLDLIAHCKLFVNFWMLYSWLFEVNVLNVNLKKTFWQSKKHGSFNFEKIMTSRDKKSWILGSTVFGNKFGFKLWNRILIHLIDWLAWLFPWLQASSVSSMI
jgi:hypothetical protein